MQYENIFPDEALPCIKTLENYGYSELMDFFYDFRNSKKSIVDSLEMYLQYPCGTKSDIIFRKTLDMIDAILGGLDAQTDLFIEYTQGIINQETVQKRIQEIRRRLNVVIGKISHQHSDNSEFDLAVRLEKHARLKKIDTKLYSIPGVYFLAKEIYFSLGSMQDF